MTDSALQSYNCTLQDHDYTLHRHYSTLQQIISPSQKINCTLHVEKSSSCLLPRPLPQTLGGLHISSVSHRIQVPPPPIIEKVKETALIKNSLQSSIIYFQPATDQSCQGYLLMHADLRGLEDSRAGLLSALSNLLSSFEESGCFWPSSYF